MSGVLVIGLDGATWNIIKPLVKKGKLPAFKKLMEEGVYADLKSTIPPITGPAWVSFATGKDPGKHGCFDFILPKDTLNDTKAITSKDINGKTFYEILDENGKKCILVNMPCSYPPRIKDIVITSILTQGDNCIFPIDLIDEIPELKDYRIVPDMSLFVKKKINEYVNDIRKLERNRFECTKKLFEKDWDFFFLLFSGTDWIQHVLYDKLISMSDDNSDAIKAYIEIDGYIKWFIDNLPKDTNVLFMSDHGFDVYKKAFYINGWLMREGYLEVEPATRSQTMENKLVDESEKSASKGINIKIPMFLLNYLKLFGSVSPFYMKLKSVLSLRAHIELQPMLSETIACSITCINSNFGGIYINDKKRFLEGKVEIKDYDNIRDEIIDKLKHLKDPKVGKYIVENVWKKEDIYFGKQLNIAPDIIFMLLNNYRISSGLKPANEFCYKNLEEQTGHALEGIFLAYGPDIKNDAKIKNIRIYDIAPTILHSMNMQVPKDMDGRIIMEIFRKDSEIAKRDITYQDVNEKKMIKEKIRKMRVIGKI